MSSIRRPGGALRTRRPLPSRSTARISHHSVDFAAENQIYGNLEVKKNNTILVRNGVGGDLQNDGSGTTCDGNYAIDDADDDKTLDEGEKGATLSCN